MQKELFQLQFRQGLKNYLKEKNAKLLSRIFDLNDGSALQAERWLSELRASNAKVSHLKKQLTQHGKKEVRDNSIEDEM